MHKEKVTVEGINRASKLFEWTWGERIREKRSCVSYRERAKMEDLREEGERMQRLKESKKLTLQSWVLL